MRTNRCGLKARAKLPGFAFDGSRRSTPRRHPCRGDTRCAHQRGAWSLRWGGSLGRAAAATTNPKEKLRGAGGELQAQGSASPSGGCWPHCPKISKILPRALLVLPLGQGKAPPSVTLALRFIFPRRGFCLLLPKSRAREAKALLNASKALCKCPASEELRGCFSWGQPRLRLPAGNLRAQIRVTEKGALH